MKILIIIEFSNCINYSGEGDEDDAEVDIDLESSEVSPIHCLIEKCEKCSSN